jgi:CHASE3 domain sensor protein
VDEIEQLEIQIERLREAIQRSRRLMLAGRLCAIAGPVLLLCLLLGVLAFTPFGMVIGLALGIGGVVLMGSSKSSTEELQRSLKHTETERRAAIDALNLMQVDQPPDPFRLPSSRE